jgi:type VI secretion system secreted protein Hcp
MVSYANEKRSDVRWGLGRLRLPPYRSTTVAEAALTLRRQSLAQLAATIRGGGSMAADIFAKIGDIKGESLDDKHKDEIEVLSFSWGVTNHVAAPPGSGGGAGKATFQDLSIVHKIDKASPLLMRACATGTHLKEATITQRKAGKGQHEFLIIKMNDIIITSVTDGAATGEAGSETVSLAFAKIELQYKAGQPDGASDAGIYFKYDLKANKEG